MKRNLLLSDIDGTLTKKSLVLSHAGYLISKGLIKDDGSYKAWKQDVKNERLIVAVAENYRYQIIGMNEQQLEAEKFMNQYLKESDKWYSMLDRIKSVIKADNTTVYLVSGSSDFLVKHLASYLGCEYIATRYEKDENERYTGKIDGMFSADQKDNAVQWNIDLANYNEVEAWGDTTSDLGLFKHASKRILVDPTEETLKNLITVITVDEIIKK